MSLPLHYYRVAVFEGVEGKALEDLQDSVTQGLHGLIVDENEFGNNVPNSFIARILDDDVKSLEEDPKVESVTKVKDDPRFA